MKSAAFFFPPQPTERLFGGLFRLVGFRLVSFLLVGFLLVGFRVGVFRRGGFRRGVFRRGGIQRKKFIPRRAGGFRHFRDHGQFREGGGRRGGRFFREIGGHGHLRHESAAFFLFRLFRNAFDGAPVSGLDAFPVDSEDAGEGVNGHESGEVVGLFQAPFEGGVPVIAGKPGEDADGDARTGHFPQRKHAEDGREVVVNYYSKI